MRPCEIETEAGRLTVLVPDRLKKMLKPLQRIWASGLRRMTDKVAGIASFGDTTDILNEFLHRDGRDSFLKTTIADTAGQDGREKEKNDAEFVGTTFGETEWLDENGGTRDISRIPESIKNPAVSPEGEELVNEKIEEIITGYNEGRPDAEQIKDRCLIGMIEQCPSKSVFVMVDSILVPCQKEHRNVNGVTGETRDKKTTGIANAYILSIEGTYCFTAGTEEDVMKKVLAYLVHHDLLSNRELIFFADGARSIRKLVEKYFSFRKYSYFLDWYHVQKKCYEYFSMALTGGKKNKERNAAIRYEFFKRLWAGNINDAVAYLDGLDAEIIKSQPMVDAIKNYIGENKKDDLYSYALRKEMGLVNSSNRCEKENDIVVGDRCKGNAMSWSEDGALNIAQVRIMFINREDKPDGESKGWFGTRRAKYAPLPLSDSMQQYMQVA